MAKWFVSAKKADFNQIGERFGISPILARIIRNRDMISEEEISLFLHGTLNELHNPHKMKDMDIAVRMLQEAIQRKQKMRIIGDYDIDGICATYILLTGLLKCGAIVDTKLPDRIKDGYGINENIIQQAYNDGVELLVTCDNGIAADKQISYAKELGMSVIVTDHHEVPYEQATSEADKRYILPPADAVVDPHQIDCEYPFAGICGAVVAYKVIQVLWEACGIKDMITDELLEFAAFATIGDVMELRDENRIIVKYGMEKLRNTNHIGLRALIDATGIERDKISPFHIGFILGPCLNASGRLDTAERALDLLTCNTVRQAACIAGELKELNDSRKDMTQSFTEEAMRMIDHPSGGEDYRNDKILVLYLPKCHESLAGIIAGRIKERYYKPTFVLTDGEGEGLVKGSGRSIETYHMYEEMTKCKELFSKFGGHKMAAGLSMPAENVALFRRQMNLNTTLTEDDMQEKVLIDIPLPIACVSETLISEMELLEPFGVGNPRPLFAEKNLMIQSLRIVGKNRNVVKLLLTGQGDIPAEAVWFGDGDKFSKKQGEQISIVYYPTLNTFMGKTTIQLNIQHYL